MKKFTLADFGPYDPMKSVNDDIIGKWKRQEPIRERMDALYKENLNLLEQIIKNETETKEKQTLLDVWKLRCKISPLREKIEKNKNEIVSILGLLIRSR